MQFGKPEEPVGFNPEMDMNILSVVGTCSSTDRRGSLKRPPTDKFRRIEEYMDDSVEISFFDRFYNWEVAAGSYIVRNTEWTQKFLKGFADYEFRLPRYYHGTDNGALHAFLGEILFGKSRRTELAFCLHIYYNLGSYEDLFTFEACIRQMLGMHSNMGKIKIFKKGHNLTDNVPYAESNNANVDIFEIFLDYLVGYVQKVVTEKSDGLVTELGYCTST
ncbi:hypothetical protein NECAME_01541 [Necator americanus]|uniref:Uncharacterized protein n=1 Tax=Necator americanus TaxID=51031 RepID=W2TTJ4_NECAM|nr:hypothetical protein NECAME_01541 [Necator americanus]ETN84979.1 hypothetical protein NECAME_01541 [Necator americanus]